MTMHKQPYRQNPLLRRSYSLIAPLYDAVIERPLREARKRSLEALPAVERKNVLISGVGTGLDYRYLRTRGSTGNLGGYLIYDTNTDNPRSVALSVAGSRS